MKNKIILLSALKIIFLLIAGAIPFFDNKLDINKKLIITISLISGIFYIVTSIIEAKNKSVKFKNSINNFVRFQFITFFFYIRHLVKISALFILIFFFLAPESYNYKIQAFLITFVLGEIIILFYNLNLDYYGIYFIDNYFYMVNDKEIKIFSDEIKQYFIRYEIYYVVLKNGKTIKINPDYCKASQRLDFIDCLNNWLSRNQVKGESSI
ncbi:MAG: hypothetical protein ACK5AY_06530 [Bacteroidota bacterium]